MGQVSVLYYTILYYTLLYSTLRYATLLYSTLLYSTILYYTILYYTIRLKVAKRVTRIILKVTIMSAIVEAPAVDLVTQGEIFAQRSCWFTRASEGLSIQGPYMGCIRSWDYGSF